MIRLKSVFCKILRIKISSKSIFDSFTAECIPEKLTCPCCHSKHSCVIHSYYGRHLIDFINGQVTDKKVTVLRVICESCGHTHALLPDVAVPYCSHSLFFVLRVLGEYFLHLCTVEKLCVKFHITVKRLYQWIRQYRQDKELWLGAVEALSTCDFRFLMYVVRMPSSSQFTSGFCSQFNRSFMQTHRNPPHLCRDRHETARYDIFSQDRNIILC